MPKWIHQPNGSMAGYVNRGMSVLTAEQGAINPPRVAVSHAPDRHKADGGLYVLLDDERVASFDSGNDRIDRVRGVDSTQVRNARSSTAVQCFVRACELPVW